ncbi:MAG: phage tail tip lysozyme, partial [Eubacteriales bacterium]|nr:phage tail tip lysozyme [Eubacteriales bacterium]
MSINVEYEKRAYKKFISAGMTPEGACGLIGNLEAESDGFYSNRVEYLCIKRMKEAGQKFLTDATYTQAVDNGEISAEQFLHPLPGKQYGYGLAQWTSPGRKAGLYNLAHRYLTSIADENMQLDFLLNELEAQYQSVLKVLKSTKSIREASDIVLKKFEIPANTSETVCAGRAARGQKFFDNYVKKTEVVNMANYDKYIKSTGTHYISNSGSDENGSYKGGTAGDQTGREWELRSWYNRPWNCVLRFESDTRVGSKLAELGCAAALNNKIGYDQYQRDTYWKQLQAVGYDPSKITVACESDCSAGVIAT